MAKKQSESSAHAKRREKSAKHMPDSELDFSDIPEMTEAELASGRRVGRPPKNDRKQMIALRIDPALLKKLRTLAEVRNKPYQTLLHELLEDAVDEAA